MAAGRTRKNLTLMEDDPNHSLTLGREYPSKLSFVEGDNDDDDEASQEQKDSQTDEEEVEAPSESAKELDKLLA